MKTEPDTNLVDKLYRPTIIEFCLDQTPSMECYRSQTVAGYNTFISDQKRIDGKCLFTLTKFAVGVEHTPFIDLDLTMVPLMTRDTFIPGGVGTNLRDVFARRVRALEARLADWTVKPNVLMIMMTDGQDNASLEYRPDQIRDIMKTKEAEGWTFVFLGAMENALIVANELGFHQANSKQFDGHDMEDAMTSLSAATTVYRAERANHAILASTSYFG